MSSSWQFLDNFPVLVMQFKVSFAVCEHFFKQFYNVQTLLTVTCYLPHVHAECQTVQDSLTKLQRKLKQSQVVGRNCDISYKVNWSLAKVLTEILFTAIVLIELCKMTPLQRIFNSLRAVLSHANKNKVEKY